MPLMKWSDLLSVNVIEIDEQHKKLVAFINELSDHMKFGKGDKVISKILSGLVDYTKYHFSTEERLMSQYAYAELKVHKTEHDEFVKKIFHLYKEYNENKAFVTPQVMRFLREWLFNHITEVDKRLGDYLASKGIK
jgi:hemerythrin